MCLLTNSLSQVNFAWLLITDGHILTGSHVYAKQAIVSETLQDKEMIIDM